MRLKYLVLSSSLIFLLILNFASAQTCGPCEFPNPFGGCTQIPGCDDDSGDGSSTTPPPGLTCGELWTWHGCSPDPGPEACGCIAPNAGTPLDGWQTIRDCTEHTPRCCLPTGAQYSQMCTGPVDQCTTDALLQASGDINRLPYDQCIGEVVRDTSSGDPTTYIEYLATSTGWIQAVGECIDDQTVHWVDKGDGRIHPYLDLHGARFGSSQSNLEHPVFVECTSQFEPWLNNQSPPAPTNQLGGYSYAYPKDHGISTPTPEQQAWLSTTMGGRVRCNMIGREEHINWYCVEDNLGNPRWEMDFDSPEWQEACGVFGNNWTGTKCCSESNDWAETYNDVGGNGACFYTKYQPNDGFFKVKSNWATTIPSQLDDSSINVDSNGRDSVIVINGRHEGCMIDGDAASSYNNPDNDWIMQTLRRMSTRFGGVFGDVTGTVHNNNYCAKLSLAGFDEHYCSYTEDWLPVNNTARDELKRTAWTVSMTELPAQCCGATQCWDGNNCVNDQSIDPGAAPVHENYRCMQGEWQDSFLKVTRDKTDIGYCERQNMCLESLTDNGCVESGWWAGDDYCLNGDWTTRTRLIAEKLLEVAGNEDFRLICDEKVKSLLDSDNSGNQMKYCSLWILNGNDESVVLGTSIGASSDNNEIAGYMQELSAAYEIAYNDTQGFSSFDHTCDNQTYNFTNCITNQHLEGYYDGDKQLLLLTYDESIVVGAVWDRLFDFFRSLFGLDISPGDQLRDFSKIYITKEGTKEITIIEEEIYNTTTQEFENFITMEYHDTPIDGNELMSSLGETGANVHFTGGPSQDSTIVIKEPKRETWDALTSGVRI